MYGEWLLPGRLLLRVLQEQLCAKAKRVDVLLSRLRALHRDVLLGIAGADACADASADARADASADACSGDNADACYDAIADLKATPLASRT